MSRQNLSFNRFDISNKSKRNGTQNHSAMKAHFSVARKSKSNQSIVTTTTNVQNAQVLECLQYKEGTQDRDGSTFADEKGMQQTQCIISINCTYTKLCQHKFVRGLEITKGSFTPRIYVNLERSYFR